MPSARLEVVEDAGHCPMFEQPDQFNDAVRSFAAGLNDR